MSPTPLRCGRRTKSAATVLAALALTVTAACSGANNAAPSGGTGEVDASAVIEAGISYSLGGSFDPILASGAVTVAANWHTMEGLTEIDPATREVYPALGAKFPTEVNPTTYDVDLRAGAVFQDGSPVTSADVVFSFERTMDPESGSIYAPFVDFIKDVKATDQDTVRITLDYPFSLVNERLSTVKIVPKAAVEADAEAFGALPIGTGPYKLVSAVADDSLVFEKFDGYTGSRPARAAGLKWNLLSDPAARVTAMSSGTVSAIEDVPYIDVPNLEGTSTVESVPSFGLLFMMFNTQKKPFDDPRVRQAFFYAIDMNKVIETGLLGHAEPATSFLPQGHPNYHQAKTVYSYDPEKAKQLLTEAGVTNLSINLKTTDTGWVADLAPLFKESFDAIGVNTTLDIADSAGQYTKVDSGDLDVMIAPGDPSVFGNDPDLLMRWWYGDNVWPQDRYRWSNTPEFKRLSMLLDEGARAQGPAQQAKWNQTFDMLSDQVPLYPLFHRTLPSAWDDTRLDGFKPLPITGLSFLDVGQRS